MAATKSFRAASNSGLLAFSGEMGPARDLEAMMDEIGAQAAMHGVAYAQKGDLAGAQQAAGMGPAGCEGPGQTIGGHGDQPDGAEGPDRAARHVVADLQAEGHEDEEHRDPGPCQGQALQLCAEIEHDPGTVMTADLADGKQAAAANIAPMVR